LLFLDRGGNGIIGFYRNHYETELFKETLNKTYQNVPKDHPYKLFQFMDLDDEPCLEIICDHFEFKFIDD
jgi:hypothetical protein